MSFRSTFYLFMYLRTQVIFSRILRMKELTISTEDVIIEKHNRKYRKVKDIRHERNPFIIVEFFDFPHKYYF